MTKDATLPDARRRRFLAAAGGAGALATVAAIARPAAAAEARPLSPAATPGGYHETEHIRHYYRTARYW
ncbi:formate dehydrogenase [Massilia sp. TSP1-1-2]